MRDVRLPIISYQSIRYRAFTLVELLVVVAILGLLVAILLPSLSAAKEHAYDAKCRANLKHLYQTIHAPTGAGVQLPGHASAKAWVATVSGNASGGLLICPSDDTEKGDGAIGMDGNVTIIDAPKSVVFNSFESNSVIHGFIEQEGLALPGAVPLNIAEPGRYGRNYASYTGAAGSLAAGTVVDSYFLIFDPVGSQSAYASGSVTFGSDILGMICTTRDLDATDHILGSDDVAYPVGQGARGYESNAEEVEIMDDQRTLRIHNYHSTFPGEHARILTRRGGMASYGMNKRANPSNPRPGQLLLVEYDSTICDPGGSAHGELLRPRHLGHVNVLYTGGEVTARSPEELHPDHDDWKSDIR